MTMPDFEGYGHTGSIRRDYYHKDTLVLSILMLFVLLAVLIVSAVFLPAAGDLQSKRLILLFGILPVISVLLVQALNDLIKECGIVNSRYYLIPLISAIGSLLIVIPGSLADGIGATGSMPIIGTVLLFIFPVILGVTSYTNVRRPDPELVIPVGAILCLAVLGNLLNITAFMPEIIALISLYGIAIPMILSGSDTLEEPRYLLPLQVFLTIVRIVLAFFVFSSRLIGAFYGTAALIQVAVVILFSYNIGLHTMIIKLAKRETGDLNPFLLSSVLWLFLCTLADFAGAFVYAFTGKLPFPGYYILLIVMMGSALYMNIPFLRTTALKKSPFGRPQYLLWGILNLVSVLIVILSLFKFML